MLVRQFALLLFSKAHREISGQSSLDSKARSRHEWLRRFLGPLMYQCLPPNYFRALNAYTGET
jgi:hypothetical protein